MPHSRVRIHLLLLFTICLALFFTVSLTRTASPSHAATRTASPSHAAGRHGLGTGLSAFVGYAEIKGNSGPKPGTFPKPWLGSPNTVFLGGPVQGQIGCTTKVICYDTGAVQLHNNGSSNVKISDVSVDVHSTVPGGQVYDLWGSFTVPAGKSVILAENPRTNNPNYDNFDSSATPNGNCTPILIPPTVTITIGGVATRLVDTGLVIDTGGVDHDACSQTPNESIQWQSLGTVDVASPHLTLSPSSAIPTIGQPLTETAAVLDGSNAPLPNVKVTFSVISGPDAGQSGSSITSNTGQASFIYTGNTPGTDTVVATVTGSAGTYQSNQSSVLWTSSTQPWNGADIGNPPLAGSHSLSNGIWTVAGSGRDIGGTADQFHFVWLPLAADGGFSAHVLTETNTNSLARAGVMLRQSTDPGAPFYAVVVTPLQGIFVLERTTLGGWVSTVASLAGTVPVYLQVQRAGTTFTAYTSSDGSTWTLIPGSSVTLSLTGTLLAGMAVTSVTVAKVNTSTFGAVTSP